MQRAEASLRGIIMRNGALIVVVTICMTPFMAAQSTQLKLHRLEPASDEIVVMLNPSVSSEGLAYLASVTIPVEYRAKDGESLAAIAKRRYGIATRFRASLR